MNNHLNRLSKDVSLFVEEQISFSGILYRIFSRAKTLQSIENKIIAKNYGTEGKKMQDCIGVRIALYFNDDVDVVHNILKNHPRYLDETIDDNNVTVFEPKRLNLIFRLNESESKEINDVLGAQFYCIDNTFEIQLRTVLSEGWHEVEHDLRYKHKDDWDQNDDISRVLNGIYATLETQDWSIISIFEKLAYRHYKECNWNAMLRTKFRVRFQDKSISKEMEAHLSSHTDLTKTIYRLNRRDFLQKLIKSKASIPLTMDNFIYLLNLLHLKDENIFKMMPSVIKNNPSLKTIINSY